MSVFMERVSAWLSDVPPIDDPVDRRNAPFVQVLLIFFSAFVIINKAIYLWAVSSGRWQSRSHLLVDMLTDLALCIGAWAGVWMIRRGHFRRGVQVFLATVLAIMVGFYPFIDIKLIHFDVFPVLMLALVGLVLGRRATLVIVSLQLLAFMGCFFSNVFNLEPNPEPLLVSIGIIVATIGGYLLVAIVVIRAATTLRASLAESVAKSERLEKEMAERERAQAYLIHAQKMEAVGRVASGVAHDFDNVLGVILGLSSRRERLADGGTARLLEAMEDIHTAAERASLISKQLLGFSRRDARRPESLDIRDTIFNVHLMMRQLFGARVKLSLAMAEEPLWVKIDRAQLEVMLLSMASNANDAMPDGGAFTIHASIRDHDRVIVELTDTGEGIDADKLERIFEPFYTTKALGSGTGLGLALVRDVLIEAGGNILARSTKGGGTTFQMELPLSPVLVA